jgi:hypothetical protein
MGYDMYNTNAMKSTMCESAIEDRISNKNKDVLIDSNLLHAIDDLIEMHGKQMMSELKLERAYSYVHMSLKENKKALKRLLKEQKMIGRKK